MWLRRLGVDALGREQVLDAERHAFERPALALAELLVARLGHLAGLVGGHRDIGVEARIGRFDGTEIGVRSPRRRRSLGP